MKPDNPRVLIEKYNLLKEKYELPEFSAINKIFDVEEINVKTNLLLKKIREIIGEKISEYSRFLEIIINPSNAPMFFFRIIKKLDKEDRDYLLKIYEKLGYFELKIVSLDIDYEEKREAEFIKETYIFFEDIKKDLKNIIEKLNSSDKSSEKTNGSYLG
jgi:hypothetical protein